jgi:hypothetical protein
MSGRRERHRRGDRRGDDRHGQQGCTPQLPMASAPAGMPRPPYCILCDRPTCVIGCIVAPSLADLGLGTAPPGKQRLCFFGLCERHDAGSMTVARAVERAIRCRNIVPDGLIE